MFLLEHNGISVANSSLFLCLPRTAIIAGTVSAALILLIIVGAFGIRWYIQRRAKNQNASAPHADLVPSKLENGSFSTASLESQQKPAVTEAAPQQYQVSLPPMRPPQGTYPIQGYNRPGMAQQAGGPAPYYYNPNLLPSQQQAAPARSAGNSDPASALAGDVAALINDVALVAQLAK
jgi:hypothetical protein